MARRKHAGGLTLDDLCSRYGVDRSRRTQHGAPLDAELLAAVYVELTTTRPAALQIEPLASALVIRMPIAKRRLQTLPPRPRCQASPRTRPVRIAVVRGQPRFGGA
jgi:DNA polymerase III subunit epsilon